VYEWPGRWHPDDVKRIRNADRTRTYLASSRDGIHFNLEWIYAQQPLISAEEDSWDAGTHKHAAEIVTASGQHWLYYQGCPHEHEWEHEGDREAKRGNANCAVGLVQWLRDRLVALEPISDNTGVLTTYPFILRGVEIAFNVDILKIGGHIRVELLDDKGSTQVGLGADTAILINRNSTHQIAKWIGVQDLSRWLHAVVRLRISITFARLWSFQVLAR